MDSGMSSSDLTSYPLQNGNPTSVTGMSKSVKFPTAKEFLFQGPSKESEKSSSSSSPSECGSFVEQKPLKIEYNFFENLSSIPAITDMFNILDDAPSAQSVEMLEEEEEEEVEEIETKRDELVYDISGVVTPTDFQEGEEEQTDIESVFEESDKLATVEYSEDDELLKLLESDKEDFEHKVEEKVKEDDFQADLLKAMTDLGAKVDFDVEDEEIDIEAVYRAEKERKLQKEIREFLNYLINRILDPNMFLKMKLDKVKLAQELIKKFDEMQIEKEKCEKFNRLAVEHFKRKKRLRSLIDANSLTVSNPGLPQFRKALATIDTLLNRDKELQGIITNRLAAINKQLQHEEQNYNAAMGKFEKLISSVLLHNRSRSFEMMIEHELSLMNEQRDKISEVRLALQFQQHVQARLEEKLTKLKDLGDGLVLQDYENLRTIITSLSQKNEERNVELIKNQLRRDTEVHIMSHMREKTQMLRHVVMVHKKEFNCLEDQKDLYRQYLYRMKLNQLKQRRQIHELSVRGGLIDKPELMIDYDETVERIKTLRNRIVELNKKHEEMMRKVDQAQEQSYGPGGRSL